MVSCSRLKCDSVELHHHQYLCYSPPQPYRVNKTHVSAMKSEFWNRPRSSQGVKSSTGDRLDWVFN
eukprot:scaffold148252_cov13-Tisochrysis_lutea.AAC.1